MELCVPLLLLTSGCTYNNKSMRSAIRPLKGNQRESSLAAIETRDFLHDTNNQYSYSITTTAVLLTLLQHVYRLSTMTILSCHKMHPTTYNTFRKILILARVMPWILTFCKSANQWFHTYNGERLMLQRRGNTAEATSQCLVCIKSAYLTVCL